MSTSLPEPPAPRVRPPWRLLIGALAVAVVMGLGPALLVARLSAGPQPRIDAHPRPSMLPSGTQPSPLTVTAADGRHVTCPTGSEPAVALTDGAFTPTLGGGVTMRAGRYHIRLRGTVNNETGAAVDVRALTAVVRGRFWPARVTVARTIPPQSSVPVVIEGTYQSTESGSVRISSKFDWRWHSSDLADCGETGLVVDD
jgi:hypothetical protein